jgi:hypothetical protein
VIAELLERVGGRFAAGQDCGCKLLEVAALASAELRGDRNLQAAWGRIEFHAKQAKARETDA